MVVRRVSVRPARVPVQVVTRGSTLWQIAPALLLHHRAALVNIKCWQHHLMSLFNVLNALQALGRQQMRLLMRAPVSNALLVFGPLQSLQPAHLLAKCAWRAHGPLQLDFQPPVLVSNALLEHGPRC
jgi:hypothetical protein